MRPRGARRRRLVVAAAIVAAGAATAVAAQPAAWGGGWTLAGSVTADVRWFSQSPALPGQLGSEQGSMVLAPEWRWRSEDRRHQVTLAPFYRWDAEDDERTHFDLREAFYRYAGEGWDLTAGVNRVFWGVAESRHLVDVVNQTDAVEDIDEEDRLGQPMVQLGWNTGWGRFELLSLLGFRERTFAGAAGRLRMPLVVDGDHALYESGAATERVDWAVRWSNAIGAWDLGAHLFYGTGREPRLLPSAPSSQTTPGDGLRMDRATVLVPFYDVVGQAGIDAQYTRQAWLWKLEGLVREGHGKTFGAAVAGLEYTLYQLGGSAADLGLIAEVHWDGRDASAPPSIYDEDTFLGARLALNDVQDTSLLVGGLIDNQDGSTAIFLEAERRLRGPFSVEVEGRFFVNVDRNGDLAIVAADDLFTVRLAWNL